MNMRNMADNPEIFVESRIRASAAGRKVFASRPGDPRAREGNKVEHHFPDHIRSVGVCVSPPELARLVGRSGKSQTLRLTSGNEPMRNELTTSEFSQNSDADEHPCRLRNRIDFLN
jgi:hypothetical protein